MTKELTCVVCPAGCRIAVELDENGKAASVTGNACPRGKAYAESEVTHPTRTLTSTVTLRGAANGAATLPVRTSRPIPRDALFAAMDKIRALVVDAPVRTGDALISDFIEPGTNLIACKTVL